MSDWNACLPDPPNAAPAKTHFKDLLQRLADSHEEEVAALLSENANVKLENSSLRRQVVNKCDETWFTTIQEQIAFEKPVIKPHAQKNGTVATTASELKAVDQMLLMSGNGSVVSMVSGKDTSQSTGVLEWAASIGEEANAEYGIRSSFRRTFVLSPHWVPGEVLADSASKYHALKQMATRQLSTDIEEEVVVEEYQGRMARLIVAPSSYRRLIWDIIGMLLIFYDIVTIPLGVFSRQEAVLYKIGDWTTQLFWTFDMFASCITGFVDHGNTIMHPCKILKQYFKTWFWVDIVVVGLDWFVTVIGYFGDDAGDFGGSSATDMVKLVRILRIVRVLRLLRLAKLKRIINQIYDHINSEYSSIIMNIVKLVLFLLIVNHIIACCWFFISDSREDGKCWVKYYKLDEASWQYQYLTSMHWSLTQFTPASMHVQPQNSLERSIALFIIMVAMLMFSSVVGSITGSMTQLRALRENEWKQFWLLRRYLRQQMVPTNLSVRIQRYLEYACGNRKEMVPPSAVNILSLLSDQLKDELECAIVLPSVIVHCLFMYFETYFSVTLNRLARHAITRKLLARYDSLFFQTDVAFGTYFSSCGELRYCKSRMATEPSISLSKSKSQTQRDEMVVTQADCLSEPALWSSRWEHVGELKALSECDVIAIIPTKFAEIVTPNPALLANVQNYAKHYIEWLGSLDMDSLSDLWPATVSEAHMMVEKPMQKENTVRAHRHNHLMKTVKSKLNQDVQKTMHRITAWKSNGGDITSEASNNRRSQNTAFGSSNSSFSRKSTSDEASEGQKARVTSESSCPTTMVSFDKASLVGRHASQD